MTSRELYPLGPVTYTSGVKLLGKPETVIDKLPDAALAIRIDPIDGRKDMVSKTIINADTNLTNLIPFITAPSLARGKPFSSCAENCLLIRLNVLWNRLLSSYLKLFSYVNVSNATITKKAKERLRDSAITIMS